MKKMDISNKVLEELLKNERIAELLHIEQKQEKKKHTLVIVFAVIGVIAALAGAAYACYKFFAPDFFDDWDDDFDDDWDDDLDDDFFDEEPFEDEDEE